MSNWDTSHSVFMCFGERKIALSEPTTKVESLETPVRNWVDEEVLV